MKKVILFTMATIVALGIMSFSLSNENSENLKNTYDNCTDWDEWESTDVYIKICEYSSGGSGYYKFKNDNDKGVRISFTLYFANGKTSRLSTNIKAYSETNGASCFSCAKKNGGADQWQITKMTFEGEEGYW